MKIQKRFGSRFWLLSSSDLRFGLAVLGVQRVVIISAIASAVVLTYMFSRTYAWLGSWGATQGSLAFGIALITPLLAGFSAIATGAFKASTLFYQLQTSKVSALRVRFSTLSAACVAAIAVPIVVVAVTFVFTARLASYGEPDLGYVPALILYVCLMVAIGCLLGEHTDRRIAPILGAAVPLLIFYWGVTSMDNRLPIALLPFIRGSLSNLAIDEWSYWVKSALYTALIVVTLLALLRRKRSMIAGLIIASLVSAPLVYYLDSVVKPDALALRPSCVAVSGSYELCTTQSSAYLQSAAIAQVAAFDRAAPGLVSGALIYQYALDKTSLHTASAAPRFIEIGLAGGNWADAAQIDPVDFQAALARAVLPQCNDGGGIDTAGQWQTASANQLFSKVVFAKFGLNSIGFPIDDNKQNFEWADFTSWGKEEKFVREMSNQEMAQWIQVHKREILACQLSRASFVTPAQ